MLFSFLALAIALLAFHLSYRATDEITALLILLAGVFSLLFSIMSSAWFIKLLLVLAIVITPAIRSSNLQQVQSSPTDR